jgi:sulfatase maturation enzyme AslB (radical SAM superfamily)
MNENFCLQPWIGIHAWPDGRVFPCCLYKSDMPLGNINAENINNLVNNESYKTLRTQMLNGERPVGCSRCYTLEDAGSTTLRQTTNKRYSTLIPKIVENKQTTIDEIKYLDIRFSNICNFKCRTCGPELSNKWGAEIPILANKPDPGIIQLPRDQFWNFYEVALETAEEIVFAGGEALMQEEHYAALQKLIDMKKFDVKIFYTTNMSSLKFKQLDLFEMWSNFKNIEIYASIDASGLRAEYLRKGTNWNKIIENVKKLKQLPGITFNITPTISLFNVIHFPDFHREWIEQGLVDPINVRINILTQPPRQQANILRNKEPIIKKWEEYIEWIDSQINWKGINKISRRDFLPQFHGVVEFLKTDPDDSLKLTEDFGWVNSKVDNVRGEDILDIFPELEPHINLPSTRSKTFCVYPFFNLNSNTDGSVKLCCNIRENLHIKNHNGEDFNLGKNTINEIWYSEYLNSVRKKMLYGEKVPECKDCYKHEQLSGSSSRTESNRFWLTKPEVDANITKFKLNKLMDPVSSLELRLGNTCNLSCNSCWGYSSSKSNQERLDILKTIEIHPKLREGWESEKHVPQDMNHWFKTEIYRRNLEQTAKKLKRVYMTGGEPTLIKENRQLLRNLLDQGNRDCFVSFTTNGTIADSELLDLLKEFPNNEVQISIDGVRDQAYYVRYPTNWNEFTSNVNAISSLENVNIVFYTVVSAYNLFSISSILQYIDTIAENRKVGWYPIFLDHPDYLRTHIWPLDHRKTAATELEITSKSLNFLRNYTGDHVFQKVIDYYNSTDDLSNLIPMFLEFNKTLDTKRGTNFKEVFPELQWLI